MDLKQLILLKKILLVMLPLLMICIFMKVRWKESAARAGDAGADFAGRILKKSRINYFKFDTIQAFLNRKGAVYMLGDLATPVSFMIVKAVMLLLLFLTGLSAEGLTIGILSGAAGFYLPDLILYLSNSVDNDRMLSDVRCVYDTLRIQTKAGVFLSESLSECYLAVRNGRLKSALLELTNDMNTRRDMDDALERFNGKFDFGQIDIFCIVIRQSLESGRSVKVLEDLSLQMHDLQHAINLKEREALDRKVQMIELLIFVGLLAAAVYSLGVEVMSSLLIS